jgi:hypothetical protein
MEYRMDRKGKGRVRHPAHLRSGILMVVIIADHPHLRREGIYAVQEFAADYLADECCDFGLVMSLRDAGHDLLI